MLSALETLEPAATQERARGLLQRAQRGEVAVAAVTYARTALVLGSSQAVGTIDAAACTRDGIAAVRRGSGGGAVLCDSGLLELDVALPAGHPLMRADVTAAYGWLAQAWATALGRLGVVARPVEVEEARAATPERVAAGRVACFASLGPYELVDGAGRKLVGLAQRRRGGAVLFQSAAACSGSPARILGYLALDPALRAACTFALAQAAALDTEAPGVDPGALSPELQEAVRAALGA